MLIKNELLLNPTLLEDVQILLVDNDRDTRNLYTFLLEDYSAKVAASKSIQDALGFLDGYIPNLLICEMRFLGESALPVIQRVRSLAFSSSRLIPILIISTCDPINLTQQLTVKVEAYLLKPIDVGDFVSHVWNLVCLSNTIDLSSTQAWMFCQHCGVRLFARGYVEEVWGDYVTVQLAALDHVDLHELISAPIRYSDGCHNAWSISSSETRHL